VTARRELLDRVTAVGKRPKSAIVVEAEEVYAHCPKAFVRSKLWDPESWLDPSELPSAAEVSVAHRREPGWTVEDEEERQRESLLRRLA
jgi:hypothetical protein